MPKGHKCFCIDACIDHRSSRKAVIKDGREVYPFQGTHVSVKDYCHIIAKYPRVPFYTTAVPANDLQKVVRFREYDSCPSCSAVPVICREHQDTMSLVNSSCPLVPSLWKEHQNKIHPTIFSPQE